MILANTKIAYRGVKNSQNCAYVLYGWPLIHAKNQIYLKKEFFESIIYAVEHLFKLIEHKKMSSLASY